MSPRTTEQNEEIRQKSREKITAAALELFAENGYHATSIAKIASKAGVSKGLIYNYFYSKEDLLSALFEHIYDNLLEHMDPNNDKICTREEARAFIDYLFDHVKNNISEWRLFMQLAVQKGVMDLLMKLSEKKHYTDYISTFLGYFQRNSDDPMFDITLFMSIIKGFSLTYVFAPEIFPDAEVEKLKTYIKDTFFNKEKPQSNENNNQLDDNAGKLLI